MPQHKTLEKANWADQIVRTGFRELAKKAHPDGGGTDRDFDDLNDAYQSLREYAKNPQAAGQALSAGQGVNLQLEIAHISALLAGQPVTWQAPNGFRVEVTLRGGTHGLITDVITNLLGSKFGKQRKR
jgi:hypothetical protein